MASMTKFGPGSMHQLGKSGSLLTMSDDAVMTKQIEATHSPDGREVDVNNLLQLVENILERATPATGEALATLSEVETVAEKTNQAAFHAMLEALSLVIERISSEIVYKTLSSTDAHTITLGVCQMLTSYAWDAKLVLTLAAFASIYGEFWLPAQLYDTNSLAKSMAILRQLPSVLEHMVSLKPRIDALRALIRAVLEVAHCIVEFKMLPIGYFSKEDVKFSTAQAHIPTAVYWSIRSIVVCTALIFSINTLAYEHAASTVESWELSKLTNNLENIRKHLREQLDFCQRHIAMKQEAEYFELLRDLFKPTAIYIDNMKILKHLINPRDDPQPLFHGDAKLRVSLDVLKKRSVLLLISGLNISEDELSILEHIYSESGLHAQRSGSRYEVVWIPIVDPEVEWTEDLQKQFETLRSSMPWYSVHHPKMILRPVIRFVKEEWHFRNKPILVALDPQGRVVCPNAIHMMLIWGSEAYPFTSAREEALWSKETWRLELLVDDIDPTVLNWVREGKYIFVYGGDNVDWLRSFTNNAKAVALASRIPLEMLYVGQSTKRKHVEQLMKTVIMPEKLSDCWQDMTMIWYFWTRLESMMFSHIQLGRAEGRDPLMQEVKRLLSYDKEGGWAVLCRGSAVVVNGHSSTVLRTLQDYSEWKDHIPAKGFDNAFKDHHDHIHGLSKPCCRFEFPSNVSHGRIPKTLSCPGCFRNMEKFITFLCCHDESASNLLHQTATLIEE